LAVASVPAVAGRGTAADLMAMLQGASEVLTADGCAVVGAHSVEAAEMAMGFAVTGLADPSRLLGKTGLRPGDMLVLTKALGSGIVLAGHGRGLARTGWLLAAIASMRTTNGAAGRVLCAHGVTACSAIGDAGLAGNLLEMLHASGVAAVIRLAALPALPGAMELAAAGIESPLAADHRRFVPGATGVLADLLVGPQISGGLLAGVSPARLEACLTALRAEGIEPAVVGAVQRADDLDGPALRLDYS
jgi:selenide,water dikinase